MMTPDVRRIRARLLADVGARRVAQSYAEALYDVAEKAGQVPEVLGELQSLVRDVFTNNPPLYQFLASGAVARERKTAVLRATFEGRASDTLYNFLQVVNGHDRLGILPTILVAFEDLHDRRARRVRVHVESAVPLDDGQFDRLRQEVRDTFHQEPVVEAKVDPELLGGLVVRVGDWVFDASVRTRLADLQNQLTEKGSHEIQSNRDRFRTD
jgi:F-type H+-transporting ATPase subunit delta